MLSPSPCGNKTAQNLKTVVVGDEGKIKDFGFGKPDQEQKCTEFHVYCALEGLTTLKRKITLPGGDNETVGDARQAFRDVLKKKEKVEMRQRRIYEASGYTLEPDEYLFNHANQCRVSLRFTETRAETLVGTVSDVGITAWDGVRSLWPWKRKE